MSLKLAARMVTLTPTKVADLQENDLDIHTEDLSSILPEETKAVLLKISLMAGSGNCQCYPNSNSTINVYGNVSGGCLLPIKNREIQWRNTVANDDWDVYLLAYYVQKRTR